MLALTAFARTRWIGVPRATAFSRTNSSVDEHLHFAYSPEGLYSSNDRDTDALENATLGFLGAAAQFSDAWLVTMTLAPVRLALRRSGP